MSRSPRTQSSHSAEVILTLLSLLVWTGVANQVGFLAQATNGFCRDTDKGRNYYTMGVATVDGADGKQDTCTADGTLQEYFCKIDGSRDATLSKCPTGFACQNGACVITTNTLEGVPALKQYSATSSVSGHAGCADSDGGRSREARGTTNIGAFARKDTCISPRTVKEYYCNANSVSVSIMVCAKGTTCVDGACQ